MRWICTPSRCAAVVVLLVITGAAAQDLRTDLATSPYGVLFFEGNEQIVRSLNDDPSKVRLEAPEGSLTKGCVTFGTRRQDGRFEELGLICGGQDERVRHDPYLLSGEIKVLIRHHQPWLNDDAQFVRVATLRADVLEVHVPMVYRGLR